MTFPPRSQRCVISPSIISTSLLSATAAALFAVCGSADLIAGVDMKQLEDRVRVEIDGKLFTEYRFKGDPHVYCYPILGPDGAPMTRAFPMETPPDEEHDHKHHRSLWFSHGSINGVDFWHETDAKKAGGTIVSDKILEVKSGEKQGTIKSRNRWITPDGVELLTSVDTITVHQLSESERMLDYVVELTAGTTPLVFGDTKEGSFAMRIAETMRLKRPKPHPGKGHLLNSAGDKDNDVWSKRADWVAYTGPVKDQPYTIVMMQHPGNPGYPARWHARDYGLLAVNPWADGAMDKTLAKDAGERKLAAGASQSFAFRVYIHKGEADAAKTTAAFSDYKAVK